MSLPQSTLSALPALLLLASATACAARVPRPQKASITPLYEETQKPEDPGTGDAVVQEEMKGTPPANAPPQTQVSVSVSLNPVIIPSSSNSSLPRSISLDESTILTAYAGSIEGFHVIRTAISEDEGKSWREFGEIYREPESEDRQLNHATLAVLPDGSIIAAFRNHSLGKARLLTSKSVDRGFTWSSLGEIEATEDDGLLDTAQPSLLNAGTGLEIYYSRAKTGKSEYEIINRPSADGGKTWGPETIAYSRPGLSANFPSVTRLKDESLLMAFEGTRQEDSGRRIIRSTQSNDNGASWTDAVDVFVPENAEKSALTPHLMTMGDGRPILSFASDESLVDGLECCSIKMLLAEVPATFSSVKWAPQAITALEGNGNLFPTIVQTDEDRLIMIYERSAKLFTNKIDVRIGE